ncbi:MAG: DegT/DnrJ/EryC1/StrS family aminotransferase [Deltaproteobacteria bacterium]
MLAIEGGKPVRKKDNFLIFGAPRIEEEEIQEVIRCLRSGWIGTGPRVGQFEKDFAEYKQKKYAIAVNSCTAALHLAMLASGVGPGDEVITTPMTFCATINSVIHCGATPVLADCDLDTMNISPAQIEEKITPKTKAILVVHFAGRCCNMDPIMRIAKSYNLLIIEDCAHAIESEYHGQKSGTFGDIGCFSFYVTKNITTGEGGMVVTDDEQIASKIKTLALQGMSKDAWKRYSDEGYKHYEVIYAGFKYNMTDMQASLGIHQMKRVDIYWKRREEIWRFYNKYFSDLPCVLPADPEPDTKHSYHLYTPLINLDEIGKNRDWVLDALAAEGIGVGVHYTPVHLHSFYREKYSWGTGQFPNAERIGERTVSLPLSPELSDEDVIDAVAAFRKVLRNYQ